MAKLKLKKIDRLLAGNFVGPFIVTFFIALFVLVMQTLWLYIDEIAGKGVGFFLMVELLGYMSVSMVPLALPIAILISSVMVLGNLAEHYELSSFKSAGVPLWRVMTPLMILAGGVGVFSFICSNNLIPVSNLQFKTRLYDIRRQKPTLSLEEGLFNDDFQGYAIRIGEKGADNRSIKDVLIIDHTDSNDGKLLQLTADRGEMYITKDEKYFVMDLYDGWQYQEASTTSNSQDQYPFIRTSFKEWHKVFDLSEFELNQTDRDLFKSHQSMLTTGQLRTAIDSIDQTVAERLENLQDNTDKYFYLYNDRSKRKKAKEGEEASRDSTEVPTVKTEVETKEHPQQKKSNPRRRNPLSQSQLERLSELESIMETFPGFKRSELYSKAKTYVRSIHSQSESALKSIKRKRESRVFHVFELHQKFSMAVACFIFLFIGAPMGAIVRKGGFGYPILISIFFFVLFMILTIFSKNIAERFVIDAMLAAWLPCIVFFPLGLLLTYQAMNDYNRIISGRLIEAIGKLFRKLFRKPTS